MNPSPDARLQSAYEQFRRTAAVIVRGEPSVQATTILHDVLLEFLETEIPIDGSPSSLALISWRIRRRLIDRARRGAAWRNGGRCKKVSFEAGRDDPMEVRSLDELLALDEAIEKLRSDPEMETTWRVVELRFFAHLGNQDIASVLQISASSVERSWRFAKAWLERELERGT